MFNLDFKVAVVAFRNYYVYMFISNITYNQYLMKLSLKLMNRKFQETISLYVQS